ncbi:MAG: lipocalin family protein [Tidjanibacter sp.]|nr:lipocalin family protein [Tidjanibacter sp.]
MKRNLITMMLAAIVSLFALTSCEKEPADLIVGKWTMTEMSVSYDGITLNINPSEMGRTVIYTFKADGTGHAYMYEDGESVEATFTYSLYTSGDKQMLNITSEGETLHYDILTLDDNTLVMYQEETEDAGIISGKVTFTRS